MAIFGKPLQIPQYQPQPARFGMNGSSASPIVAGDQVPVDGPTNVGKKRGLFGGLFGDSAPAFGAAGEALGINPKWAMLSQLLAGFGGGQSPAFAMLMQDRQQQRAAQLAAQNRETDFADWQRKQEWERGNKPVNNDTINDFNWFKGLSQQDRQLFLDMKPKLFMGPDGQPYSGYSQSTAQAPQVIGAELPGDGWELEGGAGGHPAGGNFR